MDFLNGLAGYLHYLYFLPLITVLVFVHELGHYWVARRNGVRVQVFSVGFGRELFGFTDRHGTRWKFALIPLGGYVKMFGEHALEEVLHDPKEPARARAMTQEEKTVSFDHKRLGQKAAIVFAGPAANFLFAIVLFASLAFAFGQMKPGDFVRDGIGGVAEGSAAEAAGLAPGDRILSVDGQAIDSFIALRDAVLASEGRGLRLDIARGDDRFPVTLTPRAAATQDGQPLWLIGVHPPGAQREDVGIAGAAWAGVQQTAQFTWMTLASIGEMVVGDRGTEELGGPIRIVQISGQAASAGMETYLLVIAVLSINLGLINLFPIPMLDGGHLLFYGIEALRGRPLGERAQEMGMRIGLAFILGLMIFLTVNDLLHFDV